MLKKFVPLDGEVKPAQDPYSIRTFMHPAYDDSTRPVNIDPCYYGKPSKPCIQGRVPVSKSLTTEEAIFRLLEIPLQSKFQTSCKKKCKKLDPYTACVMKQRTPAVLKHHSIVRENYLKVKSDTMKRVHDAQEPSSDEASLIKVDSPIILQGRGQPKPASPSCSLETFYVPSRRLLDLKRQRSGIFVNETPRTARSTIPFETYNPRKLQEKLESEGRTKYVLFSDGNRVYFPWTQEQDDMGDQRKCQFNALRRDCINFNPVIFPIPDDLHKTFKAQVVFGNEALPPYPGNIGPHRPKEVACLFAAYVESFSKNPDYWSANTIDLIIKSGIALCEKSISTGYENPKADFDIIPELTEKEATVEMKLHLTGGLTNEPNILKALTVFFNKFHAGALCSTNLYLLIWKRCANSFYIFDPNGRNLRCDRDFNNGRASHMVIQTVEHIVHLILNYSSVSSRADFDLYEIQLKDFGKLSKPFQLQQAKPPSKLFAVVNRFYSIIPALSGLPTVADDDNISLMISYLALVYSQIDPPRNWRMQLVGDLIDFGKKYSFDYMCDNQLKTYNIVDLPEVVLLGNYRVLMEKKAFARAGSIVDCRSYRSSQLTLAIIDFFSEYDSGLLQVDFASFGLWKERNIFFVFDAFRRGPAGQATVHSKTGAGCLQIHLNIDSLCRMVYMNSTATENNGNFFLHGIRVKAIGTFNINHALEDAAAYGTLQIKYPFDCERHPQTEADCKNKPMIDANSNGNLILCLSELSVRPCERTCSESEFVQQQKKMRLRNNLADKQSIQSIPEKYRIPEFDDVDVIDSVVAELICDLMTQIQRKTEKKPQVCIKASKILLQSDRRHLEDLKLRLKRGEDYDNICTVFKTKPSANTELTLEDELAMESNFTTLPDGSWAIFGNTNLNPASESLKGILATITAAALASKYNVSTWSTDVIEYTHEASTILEDRFWSFNHTLDLIFREQIPKISLGSTIYYLKVIARETVLSDALKDVLNSALLRVNRLFLICRGLACLIVKRYNLLYMFMGCPCDVVGFRSNSPGPMCLLRFAEMNSLVRRIESACGRCGKYVMVQLEVKDITEPQPERFVQHTASKEELIYTQETNEQKQAKQRYKDKMNFIQNEIRQESKRLNLFRQNKRLSRSNMGKITVRVPRQPSYIDTTELTESEYNEEGEFFEESVNSVEYKHKPGRSTNNVDEVELENETMTIPQLGYQLRDADCLFKIQGTTSLSERLETAFDKIKPCYFASALALIYAILRPLNHWDSRRIDKVIHVTNNIAKRTTNLNTACERIITNIEVDEFIFEAKVQTFIPMGSFGGNLEYMINKAIKTQRYFLIQIPNGTFAVYHDKYFHLFDPYPSMELAVDQGEIEDVEPQWPEDIPAQPEQNTASWILFADLTKMLDYIQKRAASSEWKIEYKLHNISVVSYKTAPKSIQLFNLLTDESNKCRKLPEKTNLCTHPEDIEWLDIYPNLVIWSRLNRSNAVKRVRGSTQTKDGNYDIEIPDKLYSLWGSIHPLSAVFGKSRGKQHLAIDVVACCAANVYQVNEWNSQMLDSIVITGNDYFNDSVKSISRRDYEISLEHLNTELQMGHLNFKVHLESVVFGLLYATEKKELNLAAALTYFFSNFRFGIIQCMQRSIAIGKFAAGFFMFECQSNGLPLFNTGQGASYILRANQLQILLYCIVMTLNLPYYNAQFIIHKVDITNQKTTDQDG